MYENKLPLAGLTVINNPLNPVSIQVEKRKVHLTDGVSPAAENAWIYRVTPPKLGGTGARKNYLGPIINVRRGNSCVIRWRNTLGPMTMPPMPDMMEDPPINSPMMPGMNMSVGIVTHLHGGQVQMADDGWPLAPVGYVGNPHGFPTSRTYTYPNNQRAAMHWFHDHAMDNTARQVHAGLAGLYFVRDQSDTDIFGLIGGPAQEIPLVIQDRMVACGFDGVDYSAGIPANAAGYSRPEFLGETIFVNGRATPFHNVNRAIYRLRILNGSNARTYALALMDPAADGTGQVWHSDRMRVIGTEGGLITASRQLAGTEYLLLAPGERVDVLLDLTDPAVAATDCLRLVNLAVKSALQDVTPEGIFQTDVLSVLGPPMSANDPAFRNALMIGPANIMQFCLPKTGTGAPNSFPLNVAALDGVLASNANGDGFQVNGGVLDTMPSGVTIARNRLVMLMNNTAGLGAPWQDTQIWEMGPDNGLVPTLNLQFNVDLLTLNPLVGLPSGPMPYGIYRSRFFDPAPPPLGSVYRPLHAPTFTPQAGTYERWYVANIGNSILPEVTNEVVDMHPFHMHLVNFVVQRRFVLDAGDNFVPVSRPLDFDGTARHDTVRVQPSELLELLVYFPPGFKGDYPYHCHLVEHEDMGMMLHFTVV